MIERLAHSASWIHEHSTSEPWPSTLLVLLCAAKEPQQQQFALDIYSWFREIDDYVDEYNCSADEKILRLDNLMSDLANDDKGETNPLFDRILKSNYFTPTIQAQCNVALRAFKRDIYRQNDPQLGSISVFDMRVRGILPYISIASEILFKKQILYTNSGGFKNFLGLVERTALSGDVRDMREDIDLDIHKFTEEERTMALASPANFQSTLFTQAMDYARKIGQLPELNYMQTKIVTYSLAARIGIRAMSANQF
ncbi:MAG: hypothetical protein NUV98_05165 [Candidatus Roizmanbacteria bacterium]|nr:hypothetical protein [Candidatus Roizmanbacteria bacterium]